MKATALLEQQHREVEELFTKLEAGPPNEDLVLELATALTAHATIEEEIFYPAAKRFRKNIVLESLEEHDLMAHALKRLSGCDPERESFHAKLKATKEVVERHVQEEETELFPAMTEALGEEDEALGERMEKRYLEIKDLGYEGAIGERRARRSQEGEHATNAHEGARSHGAEKARARSTGEKSTGNHKAPARKKASHAHPRGA